MGRAIPEIAGHPQTGACIMKIRSKFILSLGAAAVSLLASAPASAATVYYHFTNVVGNVAGTVSGHISGLLDNATSAATGVWVDSYPAGLAGGGGLGSYPVPFNVLAAWTGTVNENSFTLAGGVVTGARFSIVGANGDLDQLFLNSACACAYGTGHTNFLDIGTGDTRYVWNVGDLNAQDGLVFDNGPAGGVPEPTTWAMMLAGFGAIGFAMRRKPEQKVRVRFAI
jgi:PEP-CTERM motif